MFIVSEPTKRLATESTGYDFRNGQVKHAFVKENENKYLCKKNPNY